MWRLWNSSSRNVANAGGGEEQHATQQASPKSSPRLSPRLWGSSSRTVVKAPLPPLQQPQEEQQQQDGPQPKKKQDKQQKTSRQPTRFTSAFNNPRPSATQQTKRDLLEIINKHQGAALLEANDTIRALEEQQGQHKNLLRSQADTISDLSKELEELKRQQREQQQAEKAAARPAENSAGESTSSSPIPGCTCSCHSSKLNLQKQQEEEESKRQLVEENTQLREKMDALTLQNDEQKAEIEKLQHILTEIAAFQQHADVGENGDGGGDHETEISRDTISEESGDEDDDSSVEEDDDEGQQGKQLPPLNTLGGNQLLLLFSSMPMNAKVAADQSRLETILQSLCLADSEVQVLDGCDASSKTMRDDLFRISGLPAGQYVYPQLFLVDLVKNDLRFVGDFDTIMEAHDNHRLPSVIGLTPIDNTPRDSKQEGDLRGSYSEEADC